MALVNAVKEPQGLKKEVKILTYLLNLWHLNAILRF